MQVEEKFELVNKITQTYLWAYGNYKAVMTDNDFQNTDDLIVICCEVLYSMKLYDWSVLNPVNFMIMVLLDKGQLNSPENTTLKLWSMKINQKLGLTSNYTKTSITVKNLDK